MNGKKWVHYGIYEIHIQLECKLALDRRFILETNILAIWTEHSSKRQWNTECSNEIRPIGKKVLSNHNSIEMPKCIWLSDSYHWFRSDRWRGDLFLNWPILRLGHYGVDFFLKDGLNWTNNVLGKYHIREWAEVSLVGPFKSLWSSMDQKFVKIGQQCVGLRWTVSIRLKSDRSRENPRIRTCFCPIETQNMSCDYWDTPF